MTSSHGRVIVALHDGWYGCGTGAGNSNRAFIRILTTVLAPSVRLTILPIRLSPGTSEYDPAWHQETLAILTGTLSDILPVDNSSHGLTRFGGLACFRAACASAATSVTRMLAHEPRVLIVAFDVPFFGLAPLLPPSARPFLVNVARATAVLQAPADSERIIWERAGLLATAAAGGHVAATSSHIRDHLIAAYGIPQEAVTDLTNGLDHTEQQPRQPSGTGLLPPGARQRFLLCYGRAEPYKGFDDFLDALRILGSSRGRVPHTILAAVTDGPPLTGYQRHLADRIRAKKLDVTLHTTFSHGIRRLLSHPSLAAVIIPSRTEPFGRIPLEAYAAGASPVIATTAGGLAETVTDGHTGYTAAPADPASLAGAISRALTASPAEHTRMLTEARHLITTRHDYNANVRAFLTTHAPWALRLDAGQST